ncbi:hypothetical protein [Nocardia tengchongensis]|uniref:hypothetical protein n=1 Tax=Nocardia tengchongensis TaxID=2055889 RepID=UPI003655C0FA
MPRILVEHSRHELLGEANSSTARGPPVDRTVTSASVHPCAPRPAGRTTVAEYSTPG